MEWANIPLFVQCLIYVAAVGLVGFVLFAFIVIMRDLFDELPGGCQSGIILLLVWLGAAGLLMVILK